MTINVLLCEGEEKSPDIRLLRTIFLGINNLTVEAAGGKGGFDRYILSLRDSRKNPDTAGIRDRDFDFLDDHNLNTAHRWEETRKKQVNRLGWYWERREIENYLVDPVVVQNALGDKAPDPEVYRDALDVLAQNSAYLEWS
jgi:hypothetical protein